MFKKTVLLTLLIELTNIAVCQEFNKIRGENKLSDLELLLINELHLNTYSDSLNKLFKTNLLTGYTCTIFNEKAQNISIEYNINNSIPKKVSSDSMGRFFILVDSLEHAQFHLKIIGDDFLVYDTIFWWQQSDNQHFIVKLQPRFRVLLRGRTFAGSLAVEDADIQIIHLTDTFNTKTLSCYIDDENYWNCLYLGMFKQLVIFDNPLDTIQIFISKQGFKPSNLLFRCNEYDGTIIPIKLKYDVFLPEQRKSNLSLKIAPPIFDNWKIALNYFYTPTIHHLNRIGIGIEGAMLISDVATELTTFISSPNSPDSTFLSSSANTSYTSTILGPVILFNINNPLRRNFGLYTGFSVPYCFESQKVYIHPFLGSRFFLDLNKAFFIELSYASYDLDIVHYTFNPYGDAFKYFKNKTFHKPVLKIGLQIGF